MVPPEEAQSNFFVFLGRFHPLFIHFPIALIFLLLCIELYESFLAIATDDLVPFKYKEALLTLAYLSCVISTSLGFFLYQGGEYQGEMIRTHLIAAVLLTIMMAFCLHFFLKNRTNQISNSTGLYKGSILLASGILLYTSHIGGSITHGPDYLIEHSPLHRLNSISEVEKKNPDDVLVFEDIMMPIIRSKCQSCHNEYKTKGGLRLTSYDELMTGGKSTKAMVAASDPAASELYRRLILPESDDEHMPPPEKPGLTDEEIELFRLWISEGALTDNKLSDLTNIVAKTAFQNYLPRLFKTERTHNKQVADNNVLAKELSKFGDQLGLVIESDKTNDAGYFAVSMKMPPVTIDDTSVNALLKYKKLISKISLPGSDISDDAFFYMSEMTALKQLYIPKTAVTGEGLVYLKTLPKLVALNLSDSKLSDKNLLNILHLPALQQCYIANNNLADTLIETIRLNQASLQLLKEEGPFY